MRPALARILNARPLSQAVTFDGTNDYLTRGAGLTGAADSTLYSGSFWIKSAADGGSGYRIFCGTNSVGGAGTLTRISKLAGNNIGIFGTNTADVEVLNVASTAGSVEIADGWRHVLFSFDMANSSNRFIYMSDVSDLATVTTYTNTVIDFTKAEWAVGANGDGATKAACDLYDLWLAPGVYIDLSVEANRRAFISPTGKPVNLGPHGERPTGKPPLIFLSGHVGSWGLNSGMGGPFTVTGALSQASSSPL